RSSSTSYRSVRLMRMQGRGSGESTHCGERETQVRPDMTIRMPGGLIVPVDSKAPLDAYLDALQATSEQQRKERLRRYAGHVLGHVAKLAAKSYEEQFASARSRSCLFPARPSSAPPPKPIRA